MKEKKTFGIISLVSGILILLNLAGFVLLKLFPGHAPEYVQYFLLGFSLVFTGIASFFFSRYNRYIGIEKNLKQENYYNFIQSTAFNNQALFEEKVALRRKKPKNRRKEQYLIAFTGSTLDMTQNISRRGPIRLFNTQTMLYLTDFFKNHPEYKNGEQVTGFTNGIFLIYLIGSTKDQADALVQEITKKLYAIVEMNQLHILISPCFGVAKVLSWEALNEGLQDAMVARDASERNFETLTYYQTSLRNSTSFEETNELWDALKNNEFLVYYQPKYDLQKKQFTSAEGLIRWNSKKYGLLSPNRFIPKAESAGLTHEIDTFVFRRVCQDLSENQRRGRRMLPVSINFSLYEFYSPQLIDYILDTLKKYSLSPKYFQIEILESTSQANPFLAISIIKKLKEAGIKVLMDDFGIGYSNIGNLQRIPFDAVKIDKSYVDNIAKDPRAEKQLQLLIETGRINHMAVIAEGADNSKQIKILKKDGCDVVQGYYYSKPLPKDQYDSFLASNPYEALEEGD